MCLFVLHRILEWRVFLYESLFLVSFPHTFVPVGKQFKGHTLVNQLQIQFTVSFKCIQDTSSLTLADSFGLHWDDYDL